MDFLKRKKTYLMAAALAAVALVYKIDLLFNDLPETPDVFEVKFLAQSTYDMLKALLIGGGVASLRHGMTTEAAKGKE